MQTQFKLSPQEAKDAVQGFVAKHQRNKNLTISSLQTVDDGSVIVCAEIAVKEPVKRKPRAKKEEIGTKDPVMSSRVGTKK